MSNTRIHLFELLKNEFKNKNKLAECIQHSKKKIQENDITRIFDKFPDMLEEQELSCLIEDFLKILGRVQDENKQITDADLISINETTQAWIKQTFQQIALMGCDDLLSSSIVNKQIANLLEWGDLVAKIDIAELIKAYTANIVMKAFCKIADKPNIDQLAFGFVNDYINKHSRKWIIETITKNGHFYLDAQKPASNQETQQQHSKFNGKKLAVPLITGGAAALTLSYFLFGHPDLVHPHRDRSKESRNRNDEDNQFDDPLNKPDNPFFGMFK